MIKNVESGGGGGSVGMMKLLCGDFRCRLLNLEMIQLSSLIIIYW